MFRDPLIYQAVVLCIDEYWLVIEFALSSGYLASRFDESFHSSSEAANAQQIEHSRLLDVGDTAACGKASLIARVHFKITLTCDLSS